MIVSSSSNFAFSKRFFNPRREAQHLDGAKKLSTFTGPDWKICDPDTFKERKVNDAD